MACADLMEGNQWHGLLRDGEIDLVEEATSRLLSQIRPEMVGLVDAFDYPDNLLSSALGKYVFHPNPWLIELSAPLEMLFYLAHLFASLLSLSAYLIFARYDGNYQEALLKTAEVNTATFHGPKQPPRFFCGRGPVFRQGLPRPCQWAGARIHENTSRSCLLQLQTLITVV